MLQLARLGRRLSTAGKISIVYTYSSAAAGVIFTTLFFSLNYGCYPKAGMFVMNCEENEML
jgi:hypothetical protein